MFSWIHQADQVPVDPKSYTGWGRLTLEGLPLSEGQEIEANKAPASGTADAVL